MTQVLRERAERQFAAELAALADSDRLPRPPQWQLSPQAVVTYLIGGTLPNGVKITPKYIGSRRLMEIAVATLATDRALLLLGVPGTAKSWVSEHLAAAISGDSSLLVQGTAGTSEEAVGLTGPLPSILNSSTWPAGSWAEAMNLNTSLPAGLPFGTSQAPTQALPWL